MVLNLSYHVATALLKTTVMIKSSVDKSTIYIAQQVLVFVKIAMSCVGQWARVHSPFDSIYPH